MVLTPDFLYTNGVVPRNWAVASPALQSPLSSTVIFANGVTVTVAIDRIAVEHRRTDSDDPPRIDRFPDLLAKVASVLPSAQYSALGFNFVFVTPEAVPDDLLADRFLMANEIPKLESRRRHSTEVSFILDLQDTEVTVKLQSALAEVPGQPRFPVASMTMNYNFNLVGSAPDILSSTIRKFDRSRRHAEAMAKGLLR